MREPPYAILATSFAAGFVVIYVWAWVMARSHGEAGIFGPIPAAILGGVLGGLSALVVRAVDDSQLLGL